MLRYVQSILKMAVTENELVMYKVYTQYLQNCCVGTFITLLLVCRLSGSVERYVQYSSTTKGRGTFSEISQYLL